MYHGVIKAGFREPRLIGKEGEDKLDEAPLLMLNLGFGHKHLMAGEERRARMVGQSYGNQTHSYGRFLGRIGRTKLPFGLPPWAGKTGRSQKQQNFNPVLHPDY